MTAPMPKDNEVDETPHWGDLMREIRSKVPEGLAPLVDRLSFACDQRLSFLLHERYEQDLSHAATVAELRAEVERLRKSNELYSFAMNTAGIDELKRRADAAERRVGELEGALHVVHDQHKWMYGERDREKARADRLESFVLAVRQECFDYWNEGIRPWPHHMRTIAWKADEVLEHATLTGADPT